MSFRNHETNGEEHELDLLIMLHQLHVSYCRRSGCREERV